MQKRSLENQLSYQSFKADAHKKASAFLVPKIFKNIIKIGSRFFIRIVKKVLDMNFLFIYEQILIYCEINSGTEENRAFWYTYNLKVGDEYGFKYDKKRG